MPEKTPLDPPPRLTPPAAGERDYYTDRASDAKKALAAALGSMKQDAAAAVDPRGWAAKKPWLTVGLAAAAGLAAGYAATPNKTKTAARRLATIERILDAEAKARGVDVKARKKKLATWKRFLLSRGLGLAKPLIISTITGLLTGKAAGAQAGENAAGREMPSEPG
jgi:hypothetical protein